MERIHRVDVYRLQEKKINLWLTWRVVCWSIFGPGNNSKKVDVCVYSSLHLPFSPCGVCVCVFVFALAPHFARFLLGVITRPHKIYIYSYKIYVFPISVRSLCQCCRCCRLFSLLAPFWMQCIRTHTVFSLSWVICFEKCVPVIFSLPSCCLFPGVSTSLRRGENLHL